MDTNIRSHSILLDAPLYLSGSQEPWPIFFWQYDWLAETQLFAPYHNEVLVPCDSLGSGIYGLLAEKLWA